jgi:hypothetical protein
VGEGSFDFTASSRQVARLFVSPREFIQRVIFPWITGKKPLPTYQEPLFAFAPRAEAYAKLQGYPWDRVNVLASEGPSKRARTRE